jgi:D-proline reductase (dithiol) PrdB
VDTPPEAMKVRHSGYDIRGVLRDRNVAFPLDRLRELKNRGKIGELHKSAYSFIGACSQNLLRNESAPHWLKQFQSEGIEAALLVPV